MSDWEIVRAGIPWQTGVNGAASRDAAAALARLREREAQDARKVEAYDKARATVKIEGNTRAYYVLRAEAAEARVAQLEEAHADCQKRNSTLWQELNGHHADALRLEEALREITPTPDCKCGTCGVVRRVGRALAHEEEKSGA